MSIRSLPSSVLVHEIISHLLVDNNDDDDNVDHHSVEEIPSLRLVCKEWNDSLTVHSDDFWRQLINKSLQEGVKARMIEEPINEIPTSSLHSGSELMSYAIYINSLSKKTIQSIQRVEDYTEEQHYVVEEAVMNESNDPLVFEMIRQLTPFIFIEKCRVSLGPYDQADVDTNITIGNVKCERKSGVSLLYRIYRCDYGDGNGGLMRSSNISLNNNDDTMLHSCEITSNGNFCDFNGEEIKKVMKAIGLSDEMVNSNECVENFLKSVYYQSIVRYLPISKFERDLFDTTFQPLQHEE